MLLYTIAQLYVQYKRNAHCVTCGHENNKEIFLYYVKGDILIFRIFKVLKY